MSPARRRAMLLLGAGLLAACAQPGLIDTETLTIGEIHNGQALSLATHGTLVLELPARTSAGYRWSIAEQSSNLKLWSEPAERPEKDGQPPAAPSIQTFTFKALAPGPAVLRLQLDRPWETGKPPAGVYAVTVDIT